MTTITRTTKMTVTTATAILLITTAVIMIGGLVVIPAMQVATAQSSCPEGSTLQGGEGGAQCVVPIDEPAICPETASEAALFDESGNVIGTQCIDNTSGDSVEPVCADEDAELDELTGSGSLSDFVCRSTEPISPPGQAPTTTVCVIQGDGGGDTLETTQELTQREISALEREGATVTQGECPEPPPLERFCVLINGETTLMTQRDIDANIAEGWEVVIVDRAECGDGDE